MLRVLGCVYYQHDLRMLAAAAFVCIFACITARAMVLRGGAYQNMRTRLAWLLGAGIVSGAGVWTTHFVAMLAYDTALPLRFDLGPTLLSVVMAMILSAAGFALSFSRAGGAAGGMVVGAAVLAMHYTGMAALRLPAEAIWDQQLIAASILIGLSIGGLAGHFAALRPSPLNNVITVSLRVLAILGVHFTGMASVRFLPTPEAATIHPLAMSPTLMAVLVTAAGMFIVGQALVMVLVDRHLSRRAQGEEQRLRDHIVELERTQHALEKTSNDLTVALVQAAQASNAKSEFLASMSHELRTPLNAVIGFSDAMVMEIFGPMSDRYKSYASDIRSSGAHLLALINDVLDLTRLDAGHGELREEVFDLPQLVSETLRMVLNQAQKGDIILSADIPDGLPALKADKRRIKQVLVNLLSNAVKFTPCGGRVEVCAQLTEAGLALAVADSGIGIAPEDVAKALEVFGQVDSSLARKYEGTGLGLPLSKQLMELHGGTLRLESQPNVGTTVTVTLPRERLVAQDMVTAA
ncbi:MAG: ATP-binding protein [Rhizomicrobium sp.]